MSPFSTTIWSAIKQRHLSAVTNMDMNSEPRSEPSYSNMCVNSRKKSGKSSLTSEKRKAGLSYVKRSWSFSKRLCS